ncbi:long-chain fatty acid transport protein 2-like [Glandiceps talaboti]
MAAPFRPSHVVGAALLTGAVAHTVYPYWLRDLYDIRSKLAFTKEVTARLEARRYVLDMFLEAVHKHPYKQCIIFNSRIYTYGDIDRLSNKFANLIRRRNLKCGDTVAMFMYNEPAFIWAYLGCAKMGVSCAFINYNLRAESLVHCIEVSGATTLVVGLDVELLDALRDNYDKLKTLGFTILTVGPTPDPEKCDGFIPIDKEMEVSSDDAVPLDARIGVQENDVSILVYTSGTTGLPKAARVSHYRQLRAAYLLSDMRHDDRMYIFLPLYHGNAFTLSFANSLRVGATMIIAKKFSVSKFWEDCRRYSVTTFVYIGEICRYLLSPPKNPLDKINNIQVIVGNGLRSDIWKEFKERFNIPVIREFYGATESTVFFSNNDNTPSAVGKLSPFQKKQLGIELVRYDYGTAEPLRVTNGRCIPVKVGQPGLLLCPINETARFDGYLSKKELTEKRIVRNAFKDGDSFFNSGDLMMFDRNYYLYFVDRVGDTFRWKGENVATTEVAQVINSYPEIAEANIYGVTVAGHDGRAGMAAIILRNEQDTFDYKRFYSYVTAHLPPYARPRFLRFCKSMQLTGTFKYTKTGLVKEGFDPNTIKEPLYFLDTSNHTYSPLDAKAYNSVIIGKSRL